MKKLELKHYLGTGLKVVTNDDNETMLFHGLSGDNTAELVEIETVGTDKEYCRLASLDEFKYVMRSLDQLTKEIEHNGEKFVPMERICEIYLVDIDKDGICSNSTDEFGINWLPYYVFEYLISLHFNVFKIPEELIILKE